MTTVSRPVSRRRRRVAAQGDDGVSLLEVIVSLGILAGIALAAVSGLLLSEKVSRAGRDRVVAANLAAERVEELRALGALAVPIGTASTTVPVKGVPFTVTTTASWQTQAIAAGTDRCVGTGQSTNVFVRATVQVASTAIGGGQPVRTDTMLTPPAGAGVTTAVRVKLVNAGGVGLAGRTVNLATLPSGATVPNDGVPTDSFGCKVFSGLPSGTYRVTVDAPGFVSVTGVQRYVEDVVADTGQPPPLVTVGYDQAGAVSAGFTAVNGFSAPLTSPGLVLANQGLRPLGAITVEGATSRTGLFPFPGGYQAWLGVCRDADPAFHGGARTTVSVPAGSTTASNSVSVPSGRLTINLRAPRNPSDRQLTAAPGQALRATNVSTTCLGGVNQVLELGSTNNSGQLSVLLPYGTWEITAPGGTAASSWPRPQLTPAAPASTLALDLA